MTINTNVISSTSAQLTGVLLNATVIDTYAAHFHWEPSLVNVIKVTIQILAAIFSIIVGVMAHYSTPGGQKVGELLLTSTQIPQASAAEAIAAAPGPTTSTMIETKNGSQK